MTEEIKKPPLLNRILRCSACAKKLLYGILITISISAIIFLITIQQIIINPHYVVFTIVLGIVLMLYGVLIFFTYKGFKAYCDKDNLYYDDYIAAILGFVCCFGIFLLSLAIFVDEGSLFDLILEKADDWNHVQ